MEFFTNYGPVIDNSIHMHMVLSFQQLCCCLAGLHSMSFVFQLRQKGQIRQGHRKQCKRNI